MAVNDVSNREHENDEEKGTKHRALRYSLEQRSSGEGAVVDMDKLLSGGEIGFEPGEKDGLVASVKGCSEVIST